MSKFQKGDRVVHHWRDGQLIHVVGVVGEVATGGSIYVRWPSGGSGWYDPEELEREPMRQDWDKALTDAFSGDEADPVSAPSHYLAHPSGIETITITRHESFLRGNVLKYVLRAPYKNDELEDMRKAAQYLAWEIERLEAGK